MPGPGGRGIYLRAICRTLCLAFVHKLLDSGVRMLDMFKTLGTRHIDSLLPMGLVHIQVFTIDSALPMSLVKGRRKIHQ